MAKTGFFDSSQGIYLPKDSLTWTDLNTSPYATWDNWTCWYQNLDNASTTVEFTSDTIDFGSKRTVLPLATITGLRDGTTDTGLSFLDAKPSIVIEGSNAANMSSATSITLTRDPDYLYENIGAFRYYRFTFNINSGNNTTAQGFTGFNIVLSVDPLEEVLEGFDTSTVDDGSSTTRTIPTSNAYTAIKYVGFTPTATISDTEETVSGGGSLYMVADYVATDYVSGSDTTLSSVSITTLPLAQLVSKTTNSITLRILKPNTGDEVDTTADILVRGLPQAGIDVNGNLIKL